MKDQGIGIAEADQVRIFQNFEQPESEPGKGSLFYFTLNLKIAEEETRSAVSESGCMDLTGMKVLIAEDNELNMEILKFFLDALGCEADGVCNGQQAAARFQEMPVGYYDVILMDIMMPVMGGVEAAHQIRMMSRADAAVIPIIAVSANAFEEDIKKSLAGGMNAHLSKPIEREKLEEILAKVKNGGIL